MFGQISPMNRSPKRSRYRSARCDLASPELNRVCGNFSKGNGQQLGDRGRKETTMNDEIDLVRSLGGTPVPDDAVHDRVLATVEKRLARSPRRGSMVWGLTAAALVIAVVAGIAITRWGGAGAPPVTAIPSFPKGWSLKVDGGLEGIQLPTPFADARDMTLAQAE